ncbi:hypothetical protein, partial [Streptomyces albus]|uniref:hypothetical protein n=1 Tax=Streptomyces albus TaxID=1888 RepID=UPI000AC83686
FSARNGQPTLAYPDWAGITADLRNPQAPGLVTVQPAHPTRSTWEAGLRTEPVVDRRNPLTGEALAQAMAGLSVHRSATGPALYLEPVTRPAADTAEPPAHDTTQSAPKAAPVAAVPLVDELPSMEQSERADVLAQLPPEQLGALTRDERLMEQLRQNLPPGDYAETAALLMLRIDPRVHRPVDVRRAAVPLMTVMLGNPEIASQLVEDERYRLVVVPKDVAFRDVEGFGHVDVAVRGGTNPAEPGVREGLVGISEENLLGEQPGDPSFSREEEGHSDLTHELAHAIRHGALNREQKQLITDVFNAQKEKEERGEAGTWPDGLRHGPLGGYPNYSSWNEDEFFAQLTNVWLGVNGGDDMHTMLPRNNGAQWVRDSLPDMVPLLEWLYGPGAEPGHYEVNRYVEHLPSEVSGQEVSGPASALPGAGAGQDELGTQPSWDADQQFSPAVPEGRAESDSTSAPEDYAEPAAGLTAEPTAGPDVARTPVPAEPQPARLAATVPLSGLLTFLDQATAPLREGSPQEQAVHEDAQGAATFAESGRHSFSTWLAAHPEHAPEVKPWDEDELAGALALGYTQIAAVVREWHELPPSPRDYAAFVSRASLGTVRQALGPAPRAFLEAEAWPLALELEDTLGRAGLSVPPAMELDLPAERSRDGERPATVGQYLENLLLPEPLRKVGQDEALGLGTQDVEAAAGVPETALSALQLEVRPQESGRPADETLAQVGRDLYDEALRQRGLPPLDRSATHEQRGQEVQEPSTTEVTTSGAVESGAGTTQPESADAEQVPDVLPAPPSRREVLDPVRDWRRISDVPGHRRTGALRAVDEAVAGLPRHPNAQDLAGVLQAVREWQRSASRSSSRWDAVTRLEEAVQDRMRRLHESHRAPDATSRPRHRSGASAQGTAAHGPAQSLIPAGPRPVEVEGFAPASGFEAELVAWQMVLPPGQDHRTFGDYDGRVVRLGPLLGIILTTGQGSGPVLEVVTEPARGLRRGADDGRAEMSDVLAAFRDVVGRLESAEPGTLLRNVFPPSVGYEVDPLVGNMPVRPRDAGWGQMVVHHTATAPLAGIPRFLDYVTTHMRRESPLFETAYQDGRTALAYAGQGRRLFRQWLDEDPRRAAELQPWDADELGGVLALGFVQVAAAVRGGRGGQVVPKDFAAVISREFLAAVRRRLDPVPQVFLENAAGPLTDTFVAAVRQTSRHPLPADVLSRPVPGRWSDYSLEPPTIGEYLENLLLAHPSRIVGQDEALGVRTSYTEMERNVVDGVARITPPVARLEARALEAVQTDPRRIERTHTTLAQLSLDLYNDARRQRGLPPVGRPVARGQRGRTGYAPPTREQVTSGAVVSRADATQGDATQATGTRPQSQSQTQPTADGSVSAPLTPALAELAGRLPGMEQGERAEELALLPAGDLEALASHRPLVQELRTTLSAEDFADTAARLLLRISEGVHEPMSVRREAVRRIAPMLGDADVAERLLNGGHRVHVVPRDVALTADGPFRASHGNRTKDGRTLASLRGLYDRPRTGVGEENLLGETTSVPGAPVYADGYSSVTHEFAHAVHRVGLGAADRRLVKDVFDAQKAKGWAGKFPDGHWYDPVGDNPGPNYSSRNEDEFFAQLTNAWLGVNAGTDPYTEVPRNNGASWVRENLPEIVPLLERLYGPGAEPGRTGANPLDAVQAENQTWAGFRAFWNRADRELYPHHHPLMHPAPATSQGHAAPGVVFAPLTSSGPAPQTAEPVSMEALPAPPSRLVAASVDFWQSMPHPIVDPVTHPLLSPATRVFGPDGTPQGRVFVPEAVRQVAPHRSAVYDVRTGSDGQDVWFRVGETPSPATASSYVVIANTATGGGLRVGGTVLNGVRLDAPLQDHPDLAHLPVDEDGYRILDGEALAAVLAADPELAARRTRTDSVVLAADSAVRENMDLAAGPALRTGLTMVAPTGEGTVREDPASGVHHLAIAYRHFHLPARQQPPVGDWARIGPDTRYVPRADRLPSGQGGTTLSLSQVTHRLQPGPDGRLTRISFMKDDDAGLSRESSDPAEQLGALNHYVYPAAGGRIVLFTESVPHASALAKVSAHGSVEGLTVEVNGRETRLPPMAGGQFLGEAIASLDLAGGDWVYLDVCFAAARYDKFALYRRATSTQVDDPLRTKPMAQGAATRSRHPVLAGTQTLLLDDSSRGAPDYRARLGMEALPTGELGRVESFVPEPTAEQLGRLTHELGLKTADDTLVLVNALRTVFGAAVEETPGYRQLLDGAAAVQHMLDNDTWLRDLTPFRLELWQLLARRLETGQTGLQHTSQLPRLPEKLSEPERDLFRATLEAARETFRQNYQQPLSALLRERDVSGSRQPLLQAAARHMRRTDAAALLGLPPGTVLGSEERTRLFWAFVRAEGLIRDLGPTGWPDVAREVVHVDGASSPQLLRSGLLTAAAMGEARLRGTGRQTLAAMDLVYRGAYARTWPQPQNPTRPLPGGYDWGRPTTGAATPDPDHLLLDGGRWAPAPWRRLDSTGRPVPGPVSFFRADIRPDGVLDLWLPGRSAPVTLSWAVALELAYHAPQDEKFNKVETPNILLFNGPQWALHELDTYAQALTNLTGQDTWYFVGDVALENVGTGADMRSALRPRPAPGVPGSGRWIRKRWQAPMLSHQRPAVQAVPKPPVTANSVLLSDPRASRGATLWAPLTSAPGGSALGPADAVRPVPYADMNAVAGLLLGQQTVAQGPGSVPQVRVLTGEPISRVLFDRMPLLERQRDGSWREVGRLPVPFPETSYVLVVDAIPDGFLIGGDTLRGLKLGRPLEDHPALAGLEQHWLTGKRIVKPRQMAALVRTDRMFQTLPRGAKLVVPTPHIGTQSLGVVEALADALGIDPVVPTLDGGLAPVAPNSSTYRFVQRYWNTRRGTGSRLPVGDWAAIPAMPHREPRGRTWTDGTGKRFTDNDVRQRPYAQAGGTRLLGVDVLPGTDDGLRREGWALAFRDPWVVHSVQTADGLQYLGAELRPLPPALHIYTSHGTRAHTVVPLRDGGTAWLPSKQGSAYVAHTFATMGFPKDSTKYLEECETGTAHDPYARQADVLAAVDDPLANRPRAQQVVNAAGGVLLYGATARTATAYLDLGKPTYRPLRDHAADPWGRLSDVALFRAEAKGEELARRARIAGLHTGDRPLSGRDAEDTRLIDLALRRVFGADADADPRSTDYQRKVAGGGALVRALRNDPVLRDVTPFRMEMWQLLVHRLSGHAQYHTAGRTFLDRSTEHLTDADRKAYDDALDVARERLRRNPRLGLGELLAETAGQQRTAGAPPLLEFAADRTRHADPHGMLDVPAGTRLSLEQKGRVFWATVRAEAWLRDQPAARTAAIAPWVLHTRTDGMAPEEIHEELLTLATTSQVSLRALTPGEEAAELGAIDLELRGAYKAEWPSSAGAALTPFGYNWGPTDLSGGLRTDQVLQVRPDGTKRAVDAPFMPRDKEGKPIPGLRAIVLRFDLHSRTGQPVLHLPEGPARTTFAELTRLVFHSRSLQASRDVREPFVLVLRQPVRDPRHLSELKGFANWLSDHTGRKAFRYSAPLGFARQDGDRSKPWMLVTEPVDPETGDPGVWRTHVWQRPKTTSRPLVPLKDLPSRPAPPTAASLLLSRPDAAGRESRR